MSQIVTYRAPRRWLPSMRPQPMPPTASPGAPVTASPGICPLSGLGSVSRRSIPTWVHRRVEERFGAAYPHDVQSSTHGVIDGGMLPRRIAVTVLVSAFTLGAIISAARSGDVAPGWDPNAFKDDSTLQVATTSPGESEHWSNLWLVVIDNQLYVRLGDRAYGRIQNNTTKPYIKVKVAGQEFDKVHVYETPEMTSKVADAMAQKYFLDVLIRHESHPMVARLVAEAPSQSGAAASPQ